MTTYSFVINKDLLQTIINTGVYDLSMATQPYLFAHRDDGIVP